MNLTDLALAVAALVPHPDQWVPDCRYRFLVDGQVVAYYEPHLVYFERDSAALTDRARATIRAVWPGWATRCRIVLYGSRDASEETSLARRRAEAVAALLRESGYRGHVRVAERDPTLGESASEDPGTMRRVMIGVEPLSGDR